MLDIWVVAAMASLPGRWQLSKREIVEGDQEFVNGGGHPQAATAGRD